MSDEQYLRTIVSLAELALTETEWRNRKSAVDTIAGICEKLNRRPENERDWQMAEEGKKRG